MTSLLITVPSVNNALAIGGNYRNSKQSIAAPICLIRWLFESSKIKQLDKIDSVECVCYAPIVHIRGKNMPGMYANAKLFKLRNSWPDVKVKDVYIPKKSEFRSYVPAALAAFSSPE